MNGLASVPADRIITERFCLTCWGNMVIRTRDEDRHHFHVVGESYTPHAFQDCPDLRGWGTRMPVCLHCRGHHLVPER